MSEMGVNKKVIQEKRWEKKEKKKERLYVVRYKE
jgi:hypothetical protein